MTQVHPVLGEKRLTVAIIADTHLTEADGICNSPFAVNKLANDRLRYVIHNINHLDPDLTIHLGDLVHPVPAVPELFEQAVERFQSQVAGLNSELLLVPGNHDVGDKPIDWGPAGVITEDYVQLWEDYFGPNYTVMERNGCHFIIINAQLINTGFDSERKQREWLESTLNELDGQRVFLSLHYPPFLLNREEREHYDNLAEPGRGWLLDLLERHKVEALFAGHVHHFWTYRHGTTDCYLLPSTAFVRQDYSEMFKVAPDPDTEFGRNDIAKLGFMVLEIYEKGHLCRPIRTFGEEHEEGSHSPTLAPALNQPFPPHPRELEGTVFGFDMRKEWLAPIEIPPSGGLDEFDRKQVRNDYPIMALWEMGVRHVRIPRSDLDKHDNIDRLQYLHAQGMRFTLFSFDLPDSGLINSVTELNGLIESWEIAIALSKTDALIEQFRNRKLPNIYLSKLRGKDDVEKHQGTYFHVINHGFAADEEAVITDVLSRPGANMAINGFVFRVGHTQQVSDAATAIAKTTANLNTRASLHIRMGSENPAESLWDETWALARVQEARQTAAAGSFRVFVDTLADVDRGYFPRLGILDGLWNPRSPN